ncbi:MAG: CUAEP/CCAEP-tail radical SAM protein [Acidobacteria bacterium]|nr:CUAEP/CCAEP-tail radical SAM protein [Acidobacteriota bacterium]
MRVVLLSTYELGRQPFGLASPAAWLRQAGAEVVVQDLSRQRLDEDVARGADVVAFYLPMHTATRLALPVIDRVRALNPGARLCAFGLYAPPNAGLLRAHGIDATYGAEVEADLVEYARGNHGTERVEGATDATAGPAPDCRSLARPIARLNFLVPDRAGLPGPSCYASLQRDDSSVVAGYTEASRGCKYFCRHCPVVPVYRGQIRTVPTGVVLADIRNQVASGAAHITFGDPDFFNGPAHARRTVTALHDEFPHLTYDVTIKISHLLRHQSLLGLLRDTGCLFVTTAVESIDDGILATLDKGHTAADVERTVSLCRQHALALAPTFVPFTPWTSLDGYIELLSAIRRLDLVEHVAPIQLGIRLLVSNGSRLLDLPDIRTLVGPFDPVALAYPWAHRDARVDALQKVIIATVGCHAGAGRGEVFDRVWRLACEFANADPDAGRAPVTLDGDYRRTSVPYLNEPWYC